MGRTSLLDIIFLSLSLVSRLTAAMSRLLDEFGVIVLVWGDSSPLLVFGGRPLFRGGVLVSRGLLLAKIISDGGFLRGRPRFFGPGPEVACVDIGWTGADWADKTSVLELSALVSIDSITPGLIGVFAMS